MQFLVMHSHRFSLEDSGPQLGATKGEHADLEVRETAAYALGQLGEHAADVAHLHRLTKLLEHHEDYVREAAGVALGQLGEHAASIAPVLTKCLKDEDKDVRRGGS